MSSRGLVEGGCRKCEIDGSLEDSGRRDSDIGAYSCQMRLSLFKQREKDCQIRLRSHDRFS